MPCVGFNGQEEIVSSEPIDGCSKKTATRAFYERCGFAQSDDVAKIEVGGALLRKVRYVATL